MTNRPATHFGVWLRARRTEAKLSQAKLAERIGTSRRRVLSWEAGSIPSRKYRRPLARGLGVPLAALQAAIEQAQAQPLAEQVAEQAERIEALTQRLEELQADDDWQRNDIAALREAFSALLTQLEAPARPDSAGQG